jgi:16S rRNA A1518/A1519 N6-dimethyltransferase RsmA/KsgA/DIM1 with predicted DNA glycosylase/AP lyase activity
LYDKQDDFIFPIVYFPFICSNIPYFVSGPVLN